MPSVPPSDYLAAEAKARVEIDGQLTACGWVVQDAARVNLAAGTGLAVREFVLKAGHGRADYLLFVNGQAVGAIEAKPAGMTLTGVELQTGKYLTGLPESLPAPIRPLPFAYESTGVETRFTNRLDPEPASRGLFTFHRPETLARWLREWKLLPDTPTLRGRLRALPPLSPTGLWPVQEQAIRNLEESLAQFKPRALIQMATGSGKTFAAANAVYRLVKHGGATRVLFLVDRANLGRQALKEFQQFSTPDDGRKFTELYNVQHLASNSLDSVARVTISTVQRLYSILRGDPELAEEADEGSLYELELAQPVEVSYNPALPPEFFDVIIIDECHRSIYGVWRQVLDYFDAFLIGLTATPSKQTFGFFNKNLVMEYDHTQAVADGVNVDFDVYRIRTRITEHGSEIDAGLVTGFRDRETRELRWEKLDEPLTYAPEALDRQVIAQDQIRTVVRTFRDRLFTEIFPGRTEVPKTLIFAKDDSHADDIVQVVREEFGKGNEFAVKITYRTTGERPENLLAAFRNSYNPRIVVTVDMIATGTDVKPIECVFFMRGVQSRTFFEQMKGRGVRVINPNDLRSVTPDATAKDHFVIIDAVGVTETPLSDTQPLERKKTVAFEHLLNQISYGNRDPDVISSIAARLARLDRRITAQDRATLEAAGGIPLKTLVHRLVEALDPDRQQEAAQILAGSAHPTPEQETQAAAALLADAVAPIANNPEFRERLVDVRRSYEQTIDTTSQDEVIEAGHSREATERAKTLVTSFRQFIEDNKDQITALQVLYNIPYRRRLTFAQIKELAEAIARPPRQWTPEALWRAYQTLERDRVHGSGGRMLTDLVALVRFALEQDPELVPYPETVEERFEAWLLAQQQAGRTFTPEQHRWLGLIKDHIATSLAITADDFDTVPFVGLGGLGKADQLFGDLLGPLLEELNKALVA